MPKLTLYYSFGDIEFWELIARLTGLSLNLAVDFP